MRSLWVFSVAHAILLYLQLLASSLSVEGVSFALTSSQYTALMDLYNAMDGSHWDWHMDYAVRGYPWNFTATAQGVNPNPCSSSHPWQGIQCSSTCETAPCTVLSLQLYDMNLHGELPSSLSSLSSLKTMSLNQNRILGSIPESLFTISSLITLDLSHNQLTGMIPTTISSLSSLRYLRLNSNLLEGTIQSAVGSLISLQYLLLSSNKFTGTIPSAMCALSNLIQLDLSANLLFGALPTDLQNLSSISFLFVENNELSHTLPSVRNLMQLSSLKLANNMFTGSFPSSLANLSNLLVFSAHDNYFTGNLAWISSTMISLEELQVDHNFLNGSIPNSLCDLANLLQFIAETNSLTGWIPSCITSMTALAYFYVAENKLSGPLPTNWSSKSLLQSLQVNSNYLTRTLPESLLAIESINQLWLDHNHFTGPLPNMSTSSITYLIADKNFFTGPLAQFPPLCELFSAEHNLLHGGLPTREIVPIRWYTIVLGGNFFSGGIPAAFLNSSRMYSCQLNKNSLTGSIPDVLGSSHRLSVFTAGNNHLTGPLPNSLCRATLIEQWTLQTNFLSGTLPSPCQDLSFRRLKMLELSTNFLTGTLPHGLLHRRLQALYLSDNQFSGSIPSDWFSNATSIQAVALAVNCFTGVLPISLCDSNRLVQLSLSGLHSAVACERKLFAWKDSGISMRAHVHGTIPPCLVQNQLTMQVLQLSGNAFSGTIPELEMIPQLTTFSLSNNQLSGTVPMILWSGNYSQVDLSFNRLKDSIPSHAYGVRKPTQNLSLEQNRLSGDIANGLLNLTVVNILQGNLFDCAVDRSNLPTHDPNRESYSCGSSTTNDTLFILAGLCGLVILGLLIWRLCDSSMLSSIIRCNDAFLLLSAELQTSSTTVAPLVRTNDWLSLAWNIAILVGVASMILLPICIGLQQRYSIVDYAYVWTASTAYLSGVIPSCVLFVVLLLVLGACVWYLPLLSTAAASNRPQRSSSVMSIPDDVSPPPESQKQPGTMHWAAVKVWLVCIGYLAVAAVVNGAFVYVITQLHVNIVVQEMISLLLSVFKLMWTMALQQLDKDNGRLAMRLAIGLSPSSMAILSVASNVVVPLAAQALVSPNCFLYAIQSATAVQFSYPFVGCQALENCGNVGSHQPCFVVYDCNVLSDQIASPTTKRTTLSFVPPFQYSYQCSSSLTTVFAPVFLYRVALLMIFNLMLAPVLSITVDRFPSVPKTLAARWLPQLYKLQSATDLIEFHRLEKEVLMKLVLGISTNIAVMLSFGLLFPPLAFAMALWILIEVAIYRTMIGSLACNSAIKSWLVRALEGREARSPSVAPIADQRVDLLVPQAASGLWSLVLFASAVWSWMLFDTLGDSAGSSVGLGIAAAMMGAFCLSFVIKHSQPLLAERTTRLKRSFSMALFPIGADVVELKSLPQRDLGHTQQSISDSSSTVAGSFSPATEGDAIEEAEEDVETATTVVNPIAKMSILNSTQQQT